MLQICVSTDSCLFYINNKCLLLLLREKECHYSFLVIHKSTFVHFAWSRWSQRSFLLWEFIHQKTNLIEWYNMNIYFSSLSYSLSFSFLLVSSHWCCCEVWSYLIKSQSALFILFLYLALHFSISFIYLFVLCFLPYLNDFCQALIKFSNYFLYTVWFLPFLKSDLYYSCFDSSNTRFYCFPHCLFYLIFNSFFSWLLPVHAMVLHLFFFFLVFVPVFLCFMISFNHWYCFYSIKCP